MNNWLRLAISALVSLILTLIAYLSMFSLTPLLYFFAPGFLLGDAFSDSLVNSLGGYLFPVFASALIWMLLIFGGWLLVAKIRNRSHA
jgi:hypothetical protein